MSSLRFRLTLTHAKERWVQSSSRVLGATRNFATAVVTNVIITFTEENYPKIKKELEGHLANIVKMEINYAARKYAEYVPRTAARVGEPGQLEGTLDHADVVEELSSVTPPWAPLNAKWIKEKNRGRRSNRQKGFFDFTREMVNTMAKGDTWVSQQMFGPIKVNITRASVDSVGSAIATGVRSKAKIKVSIARIGITAMGKITPGMLPGLKNGERTSIYKDGRKTGLMGLVALTSPELAWKLGNYGTPGERPYRPSLEPFLTFLLTRSIPSAIFINVDEKLNTLYGAEGPRGRSF